MSRYLLNHQYSLMLTSSCTLHCSNCSTMNYQGKFNTIGKDLDVKTLDKIIKKFDSLKLKVDQLTLIGGEPIIHPYMKDILELLSSHRGKFFNRLKVITNGLFFNSKFIDLIDSCVDEIKISIYPSTKVIRRSLEDSFLIDHLRKKIHVWFQEQDKFYDYGVERDDLEYNRKLNWKRCWLKKFCRTITVDGIYRCSVMYNDRVEICPMESQEQVIKYCEQEESYDHCESCPFPPVERKWKSTESLQDQILINKSVEFINNWGK